MIKLINEKSLFDWNGVIDQLYFTRRILKGLPLGELDYSTLTDIGCYRILELHKKRSYPGPFTNCDFGAVKLDFIHSYPREFFIRTFNIVNAAQKNDMLRTCSYAFFLKKANAEKNANDEIVAELVRRNGIDGEALLKFCQQYFPSVEYAPIEEDELDIRKLSEEAALKEKYPDTYILVVLFNQYGTGYGKYRGEYSFVDRSLAETVEKFAKTRLISWSAYREKNDNEVAVKLTDEGFHEAAKLADEYEKEVRLMFKKIKVAKIQ